MDRELDKRLARLLRRFNDDPACRDDDDFWRELYDPVFKLALRFAWHCEAPKERIEEVADTATGNFCCRLRAKGVPNKPVAYLYVIVRNCVKNLGDDGLRPRRPPAKRPDEKPGQDEPSNKVDQRRPKVLPLSPNWGEDEFVTRNPTQKTADGDWRARLEECYGRLSRDERAVIWFRYRAKHKYEWKDIELILGKSRAQLDRYRLEGLKRLRRCMEDKDRD